MLPEHQLDLFATGGLAAPSFLLAPALPPAPSASALDDDTLMAAIGNADLANCRELADEATRRHLVRAVPAFEALCRRFKGFGLQHMVPEQMAAVRAIAAIGCTEARQAVTRIIVDQVVRDPASPPRSTPPPACDAACPPRRHCRCCDTRIRRCVPTRHAARARIQRLLRC